MKNNTLLELAKSGLFVKVEKLKNEEFYKLVNGKFAPVFVDYYFLMVLDGSFYEKLDFTLPKIYTALYSQYGLHNGYDDYKCSFSYRFRLTVVNGQNIYTYLLSIMDMKSNPPYFTFYRPLGDHELNQKGTYQNTVETEFSKEAMQEFMVQFLMNLYLKFEAIKDTFKKPFFRTVPYASIIYGFEDGAFFEDSYYDDGEDAPSENEDEKGELSENEEEDYGYASYTDAVAAYKNNPKMKGKMSQRYD